MNSTAPLYCIVCMYVQYSGGCMCVWVSLDRDNYGVMSVCLYVCVGGYIYLYIYLYIYIYIYIMFAHMHVLQQLTVCGGPDMCTWTH